jgi:hypothetical protein
MTSGFSNSSKNKNTPRQYIFTRREKDPNAMDVDTMTIEEQTKLMKEGRCFQCKKTGHISRDCPTKTGQKKEEQKKKLNPDAKNTNGMSIEERIKLMKEERCFKCKKHGHQSCDCPPDKEPREQSGNLIGNFIQTLISDKRPKKWDGKSAAIHIRDLVAGLDEEEKEKFMECAEEEGLDF